MCYWERMWLRGPVAALLVCAVIGCGDKQTDARAKPPTGEPVRTPTGSATSVAPVTPEPVEPPLYPPTTRSLELSRTTSVYLSATTESRRIGSIAIDTRVGWQRAEAGKGCKQKWVEIRPRGWVCGEYLKASTKAPMGREVPMLDRGELVPGVYGKVTEKTAITYVVEKPKVDKKSKDKKKKAKSGPITSPSQVAELKLVEGKPLVGSVTVRQYDEISVAGKTYWRISQKAQEYLLKKSISQHKPSTYGGARCGDDTGRALPIAFVWPRVASWGSATVMWKATGGTVRQIAQRTPVSILETSTTKDGKPQSYRIGPEEWISARDVRVFAQLPPPPTLLPGERWIDVDLDNQILVAFEGDMPVYATMVSSGTKDHPTKTGIYRMWVKQSETDMNDLKGEDPYSVATVPWTQFFEPQAGLALHTAYWHDAFGKPKSHGCVNLAPRDARWLYFWSDPQVPPGWTMAAGFPEAPGSLIRVRSNADKEPAVQGYAKNVLEARQQNAPVR